MKKGKEGSNVNIWGKSIPGLGNNQCKHPGAWCVAGTGRRPGEPVWDGGDGEKAVEDERK